MATNINLISDIAFLDFGESRNFCTSPILGIVLLKLSILYGILASYYWFTGDSWMKGTRS
ncbi:MAG: hypothetical protein FWG24_00480 [Eggerthellaceae bacterium]|nr:hypothetical protein [Eggerthellaceae bacterium]